MILPAHTFIIESISPLQNAKNNSTTFCQLTLKKEGVKNEIGESIFEDDYFDCVAFNQKATEMQTFKPGAKIQACLNIQGRRVWDENKSEFYIKKTLLIHKIIKN